MTNIYVGNLSYEATEDDIRQAFEAHGEVSSVAIRSFWPRQWVVLPATSVTSNARYSAFRPSCCSAAL